MAARAGAGTATTLAVILGGCGEAERRAVRSSVDADRSTKLVAAEIRAVSRAEPRGVRVLFRRGGEERLAAVRLVEGSGEVRVRVRVHSPRGLQTADSNLECVTVPLSAPLGDRRVVDAARGRRVRVSDGGGRAATTGEYFIERSRCRPVRPERG